MLVVEVMPLPLSPTVSGLLLALLLTVRVPELVTAVGVNLTVTVQEPLTARLVQVLVWAKAPLVAMDETEAAALVGLVTVTVCAALVVPVTCGLKVSAVGLALTPVTGYGG